MTPLQWKIIEHAQFHQSDLFGLVPKTIRTLYAAGPDGDVGTNGPMLAGLGKRFGLIPWESTREKESDRRMVRSLRSHRNRYKRNSSKACADYRGGSGQR
ncbi:MAG: hypothetical protein Q8L20_10900 [Gammaproteobacteria bacterium]|nr:hypothetical protein [Gammaproteobacteria bacterium]